MITYEQIQKANEHLSSIDVKGKDYVMVPERVKAFRKLFPEGFITTEIISLEDGVCVMKCRVGYYAEGKEIVLGSGMAYEKETNGFINRTSYIENCETSAVGRALGFLALGIDGGVICSAEELANALAGQKNNSAGSVSATKEASVKKEPDLGEIRSRVEVAIKGRTKDMGRPEKVAFLNNVVTPALHGERNWKLCEDKNLLLNLLSAIEAIPAA